MENTQMERLEELVNKTDKTFINLLEVRYLADLLDIQAVKNEAQKMITEHMLDSQYADLEEL